MWNTLVLLIPGAAGNFILLTVGRKHQHVPERLLPQLHVLPDERHCYFYSLLIQSVENVPATPEHTSGSLASLHVAG